MVKCEFTGVYRNVQIIQRQQASIYSISFANFCVVSTAHYFVKYNSDIDVVKPCYSLCKNELNSLLESLDEIYLIMQYLHCYYYS